ncbi:phosphoglycolate phosphatase [Paracoccus suum]|uniref:Phosphoglycolate phosphatase n=1 Tax=Paracoccus suum TaxID=2259340 RepID=A0A344PM10_9RHOB|nr:phosphoglycolate phosphatase [Paracoccus suum]AXC50415.1 phosphoglycolate phosphatase [Paracoccus suum]
MSVIFDLDGTLVDSAPDMHAAMNRVLAAQGHAQMPLEQVRGFIGNGVPTLVRRTIASAGAAEDCYDRWHDDYMAAYAEGICETTVTYDGMIAALDDLSAAGHRLGVCTNKPQALSDALLAALGLAGRFDAVLGGDTTFGRKPDPQGLIEVARRLGGGPMIMVGDSPADAGAARSAGMPILLYTGGYRDLSVEAIAPDAAFDHWSELPALIAARL